MKRLQCLDGLCGCLAVYALLWHMAPFAVLPGWGQSAVSHGEAAVDMFFVLSGLVIVQSLERYGGQTAQFLTARVWRIFPVFLPVFAFSMTLQALTCSFDHMPWIAPDSMARTRPTGCTQVWNDSPSCPLR